MIMQLKLKNTKHLMHGYKSKDECKHEKYLSFLRHLMVKERTAGSGKL